MKINFLRLFAQKTFTIKVDTKKLKAIQKKEAFNDYLAPCVVLNPVFISPVVKDKIKNKNNFSVFAKKLK